MVKHQLVYICIIIFGSQPSTSQPRNGSRQILLSDPVENSNNSGNSTEHNDVSKLPPEGDSRDDTSPGSRSRSSSQGSNISTNRTAPSRNRSNNRRPQQTKYSSRQTYIPPGYVPSLVSLYTTTCDQIAKGVFYTHLVLQL